MYVIKSWYADRTANNNGEFVRISGRKEGLGAWILSLVGIDPTIHLSLTKKTCLLESRTFWGFRKRAIPISRISELQTGFARPWLEPCILVALSIVCLLLFWNEWTLGAMCLAAALFGVAWFIYVFKRYLHIGVIGVGGAPAAIEFRPSFIEGKHIDANAAEEVANIIQALIDAKADRQA